MKPRGRIAPIHGYTATMASSGYNNLQYLKDLVAAGMPQAQAEVVARSYTGDTNTLVTRDYLDVRLGALEERLVTRLERQEERLNHKFRYSAFVQAIIVSGVFLPHIKTWLG